MPTELVAHPAHASSQRKEVIDLVPTDVARCEGGGYAFSPRSDVALVTGRTVEHAEAADRLLNNPPMSITRVAWMGPEKITAIYVDQRDPALGAAEFQEARKRRARQAREMRGFLDDIEATLEAAGVPPVTSPASTNASLSQSQSMRSPGLSPKGNDGRTSAGSEGRGSPQPKPAAASTEHRMSQSSASSKSNAPSPMVQPPKALKRATKRDEAEALSIANQQERLAHGELLLSAYDGTAHERDDLLQYNEWAYARMAAMIEDEEELERTGAQFSPALSEYNYAPSEASVQLITLVPGQSPVARPKTRRPDKLPPLDTWNRLPALVNAEGAPLAVEVIRAANKAYNEDARKSAKALMAHKCFRKTDFAELYEIDKESGLIPVIISKRKEIEGQAPSRQEDAAAASAE